jgi:hypothetical protein
MIRAWSSMTLVFYKLSANTKGDRREGEWDLFFILIGCPIEGKDKVATCFVGIAELA